MAAKRKLHRSAYLTGQRQQRAVLADGKPATGILGVAAAPRVGSEPTFPNAAATTKGGFSGSCRGSRIVFRIGLGPAVEVFQRSTRTLLRRLTRRNGERSSERAVRDQLMRWTVGGGCGDVLAQAIV